MNFFDVNVDKLAVFIAYGSASFATNFSNLLSRAGYEFNLLWRSSAISCTPVLYRIKEPTNGSSAFVCACDNGTTRHGFQISVKTYSTTVLADDKRLGPSILACFGRRTSEHHDPRISGIHVLL